MLKNQQHWLWSIEAACEAGARAEKLSKGQTISWKEILKDTNFTHLPTTAPKEDTAAVAPPSCSTTHSTLPAAAPTKAMKAKALGAKRAKILSIYFPKPPQAEGGKSESAAQKKQAELAAAYGSLAPQAGGGKTQSAAKKKQAGLATGYESLARP